MANLTGVQIAELIEARKSFWVQTATERMRAKTMATTLKIPYTTRPDECGGYYVFYLELPAREKQKTNRK